MTKKRWQQIEEVFQAAAELDAGSRAGFLNEACAGDGALRREVEALLEHDHTDETRLDGAIQSTAELLLTDETRAFVGRRLGVWRITGVLGMGGMGAVYRAVRDDDQFRKEVAIKLIRCGMDTDLTVSRFRHEREILARLEHPNIARILDSGGTEEGLPFFVMEYVAGKPVNQYCRDRNLSLPERLRLFGSVCAAVHYAHRNLIVHRDLKPGNILVTTEAEPKLLDFGLAKLMDPAGDVTQTITTARDLTPQYASPEQVLGLPVTTATDIYSLGVVLYEMLTGRLPYRVSGKAAGALQKAICEAVPDPPGLRNDLDNILGMALRKEPERRYGSVEQFAEDIRRYLEGRPVLAQKDTTWYVARKFIARNRVAVVAAAAVLVAVVSGAVVSTYQARRAGVEAARAERRFQQVRGLARTLMYDLNDKIADLPHSLEARVLLVKTAGDYLDSLARESAGDPAFEWELAKAFERVGNLQGTNLITAAQGGMGPGLGDDRGAYANYRKAQAIEERLLQRSPSDRKVQESLLIVYNNLGLLAESPAEAIQHAQRGLQLARRMNPPPAGMPDKGSASHLHVTLGRAHMLAGDPVAALESFRATKRVDARIWEPSALAAMGDLDGAIRALRLHLPFATREAEKVRPGTLVRRIIDMGLTWGHLMLADRLGNPETVNQGRPAEALRELRRALALAEANRRRDPGDASARDALVRAHLSLGAVLRDGDPNGAVDSYRRALELGGPLLRASVTDPRRLPGDAHSQLAAALLRAGRITEALAEARRGVTAGSTRVPFTLYTLGDVLSRSGERDAAAEQYREAVTIAENTVAKYPRHMPSRIAFAAACARFGAYYQGLGRADEARSWFEREVRVWREWPRHGVSSGYDRTRLAAAEQRARGTGAAALRLRSAASPRVAPRD